MRRWLALALAACLAGQALADAPANSLRPQPRPGAQATAAAPATAAARAQSVTATGVRVVTVPVGYRPRVRPKPRPAVKTARREAPRPDKVVLVSSAAGVRVSLRPLPRPQNLKRKSVVRASGIVPNREPVKTGRRGSVCGDRKIIGQAMSPIPGRLKGCGVKNPVKVTSVSGVALSTPSIMDCTTAKALKNWVDNGAKPAVGRLGGGVSSLKVVAHYACRTRNNQKGAKISEHGRGRAVDIAAIGLKNGASITVLKGWRDRKHGPKLKQMHKAACGPFGTVLGPNANRFHQDHFHFDTARYRSGPYCR